MPQTAKERRFRGKTAEERRRERKGRLLAAGLTAFADKGFHGVGVRDVCAAAELTERYFYESFDNLEVLFLAVYDQCVQRVREATDAALAAEHDTPEAVTRAGLSAFFGTLGEDPRIARVLLIDVLTVNADVAAQSHLVVASFAEVVGRVMVERFGGALEAGLRADIFAHGLVGATIHIGVQWVFGGLSEPLEEIVEHAVVMFEAVAGAVEQGSSSRGPGR